MRLKLKTILASLLLVLGLTGGLTASAAAAGAAGAAKTDVCQGVNLGGGSCNDNGDGVTKVLRAVLQILSIVAGVAAVIMIIIAGLRYITSGGDSSKVSGAKSAIIYAIVGLVVVVLSQLLVAFVLAKTK